MSPRPGSHPPFDAIDVAVPLRTEFGATLRIVVASIAADHGFSVDEIDDLRLAVSEVFNLLADDDEVDTSELRCHGRIHLDGDTMTITIGRGLDEVITLDSLASTILGSVVDEHRVVDGGVVLVKRATESA